uniref:ASXH domain-containing protein n=1 Tax=Globodera pallida TaxID=36090 RepID=A0A183CS41_GLOPA
LFLPNLLVTLLGIASVAGTSPSKQKHASVSEHSMEMSGKAPRHKNVPRVTLDHQPIEIPEGSNWVHVLNRHLAANAQLEKANAQNRETKHRQPRDKMKHWQPRDKMKHWQLRDEMKHWQLRGVPERDVPERNVGP